MNNDHDHRVKGRITRLYPHKGKLYFHTEGDESPYGYADSDYNFLDLKTSDKELIELVYKAAENGWRVDVVRDPSKKDGNYYHIEEIWVEFVYKEEALFNAF